jgi:anhydro-N-acetylmuramic acid kinase
MDAVDAVLAEFNDSSVEVRAQHSLPLPADLRSRLEAALETEHLQAKEFWNLDAEVGTLFAEAALALLEHTATPPSGVAAIGSHGQTLYHAPDATPPLTVQVGDPNIIASRTGITTVADFRRMDVAAGGQGAPLAPLFHAFAFAGKQPRAVLNLGGIANVTLLPHAGDTSLLGFDTGPGNTLLDLWAQEHLDKPFDHGGRWAASGCVREDLLTRMLEDRYFGSKPPKSTGRERFNRRWIEAALREMVEEDVAACDVQRTLVELTALTVSSALDRHAPQTREVYVCGGGALNGLLLQRIAHALPSRSVETTSTLKVPPNAVEGAAFAWLARERLSRRSAGRGSVTGARRSATLGAVYRP